MTSVQHSDLSEGDKERVGKSDTFSASSAETSYGWAESSVRESR